ncbi:hypothetical protein DW852_06665 [Bifidobacterium pseudocatenulatum]|nr:hypothetical protein DW852_06665 [Bifidobacterium pseudocatenulatum]RHC35231.1 hypothetical protein DW847_06645 [Bifidobacterium pseudocatenulatum]
MTDERKIIDDVSSSLFSLRSRLRSAVLLPIAGNFATRSFRADRIPYEGDIGKRQENKENEGETIIVSETMASHKASPSARILNRG